MSTLNMPALSLLRQAVATAAAECLIGLPAVELRRTSTAIPALRALDVNQDERRGRRLGPGRCCGRLCCIPVVAPVSARVYTVMDKKAFAVASTRLAFRSSRWRSCVAQELVFRGFTRCSWPVHFRARRCTELKVNPGSHCCPPRERLIGSFENRKPIKTVKGRWADREDYWRMRLFDFEAPEC